MYSLMRMLYAASGEELNTKLIKDIMYLSIAIEKTWQQSDRARERVETAPESRMVSQKDYDDTIAAAKERMLALSA